MAQNINVSNSSTALQSAADLLNQVVNQFIVRPLGLNGGSGIGGFIFDITGDEETVFSSQITDHYTEQNSPIQDQVALAPIKFVVKGYVAELSDVLQRELSLIPSTAQRLGILDTYLPGFTDGANQAYAAISATASQALSAISQVTSVYQLFSQSNTASTKQQAAYNYFKANWGTRQLFNIETPYDVLENMVIEEVRALQRDENRYVSDFSVTFKQIRYASTITAPLSVGSSLQRPAGPIINGKSGSSVSVPPPPGGPPGGPFNFNSQNTPQASGRAQNMIADTQNESTFTGQRLDVATLATIVKPILNPTLPIQLPMVA